jgi:hypothetical protein
MPSELFQHPGPNRFSFLYVAASGLLMPAFATILVRGTGMYDVLYFVLIGIGYGLIAFMMARRSSRGLIPKLFGLYLLLPFASLLDVSVDSFLNHHSRNLWGLEVLVLLVVMPFPLMIGSYVGRRYRKLDETRD